MEPRRLAFLIALSGCVYGEPSATEDAPVALLDDVRAPCSPKESSGLAATDDREDTYARVLGDLVAGEFGVDADVVGDLDGDGCLDVAVLVTQYNDALDDI